MQEPRNKMAAFMDVSNRPQSRVKFLTGTTVGTHAQVQSSCHWTEFRGDHILSRSTNLLRQACSWWAGLSEFPQGRGVSSTAKPGPGRIIWRQKWSRFCRPDAQLKSCQCSMYRPSADPSWYPTESKLFSLGFQALMIQPHLQLLI